jgi:hypothetical protein
MSSRILVAALVAVLSDALEQDDTRHLASDEFRAGLRELGGRVEAELEAHAGARRLRLADDPDDSVPDD